MVEFIFSVVTLFGYFIQASKPEWIEASEDEDEDEDDSQDESNSGSNSDKTDDDDDDYDDGDVEVPYIKLCYSKITIIVCFFTMM